MKTSYLIIPALKKNIPTDPHKYEPSSFEEEVFKNDFYSGEEEKKTTSLPEYLTAFSSEFSED